MKKFNINDPLVGYVLYERNLDKVHLIKAITNTLNAHDLFKLSDQKELPKVNEIFTFDEVFQNKNIDQYLSTPMKNDSMDMDLIYFENSLRGYLFKCNADLLDERSLALFIQAVEKAYFDHKYVQSSTSYKKYLSENKVSMDRLVDHDKRKVDVKKITFSDEKTEAINKFIRTYKIKKEDFFINMIHIYYCKFLQKSAYTYAKKECNDKRSILGRIDENINYLLTIDDNASLLDIIHTEKSRTEDKGEVLISVTPHYKDLKGKVRRFIPAGSRYELEFNLDQASNINIIYQIDKFEKSDIDKMAHRISKLVDTFMFDPLQMYDTLSLLTTYEEHRMFFKYTDVDYVNRNKKIFDQFMALRIHHKNAIALIENNKSYTYLDLSKEALALIKKLEKFNVKKGSNISFEAKTDLDAIVCILAIDHLDCVYAVDPTQAAYVIKSALLGKKIMKGTKASTSSKYQYISEEVAFTKANFQIYCEWYNTYFGCETGDVLLINENKNTLAYYMQVIPMLLSPGHLVSRVSKMTLAEQINKNAVNLLHLPSDQVSSLEACTSLKNVIVQDPTVDQAYTFKVHKMLSINKNLPCISIKNVRDNNALLGSLVPGMGVLLLNEASELCRVAESGKLAVYGKFMSSIKPDINRITLKGKVFEDLIHTSVVATWNSEGDLV